MPDEKHLMLSNTINGEKPHLLSGKDKKMFKKLFL